MNYTLKDVSEILRGLGASLEINYGSGGFSVVLHDLKERTTHVANGWDVEEAFINCFQQLQDKRIKTWEKRLETTCPGIESETKKVLR